MKVPALTLTLTLSLVAGFLQDSQPGYDDTPYLPGKEWRVHDKARPRPRAVTPGEGTAAPSDAIVLFDGSNLEAWRGGDGNEAKWNLVEGAMEVNGTGDIRTAQAFGSMQLHLEWRTPKEVQGSSQGRGNSGVFFMGRYEIQVLDSYENPTYADGQAAAMYGQYPPMVNACRPPGEWQTYDIVFLAPVWKDQELVRPARVTVFQNGVLVQHARAFLGATRHREVASYEPHEARLPLLLQDHGNPIQYRNVWLREL